MDQRDMATLRAGSDFGGNAGPHKHEQKEEEDE